MSITRLHLILPCFNPIKDWEIRVCQHLESLQLILSDTSIEPILINDGSVTGVEQKHIDYIKKRIPAIQMIEYSENHGKGFAVRDQQRFRRYWKPVSLICFVL